jgi:hypothetical protein
MKVAPFLAVALSCLALSGCHATLSGSQTTVNGTTTTVTSTHVSGSTNFAGGRVSFSSGAHPVAPAAGGSVKLSGSTAGVFVVGVVLSDWFYYAFGGPSQPKPLPPDTRIADTCSCYKKQVTSGE